MMEKRTLRQLCECCEVSRRAVQGYEKAKLIRPCGKTERGYLLYDPETLEQVKQIKSLQNYGFSVKEIQTYISCKSDEKGKILCEKKKRLIEKRNDLDRFITEISELLNALP